MTGPRASVVDRDLLATPATNTHRSETARPPALKRALDYSPDAL